MNYRLLRVAASQLVKAAVASSSKLEAAFVKAAAKPQRQLLCKGRQTGSSGLASKLAAALRAREIASYLVIPPSVQLLFRDS